jgi:xanthine dehydrogenase YagT iron-sulfur-binding subunit
MGCLAVSLPPGINAEARIPMTENSAATIVAAATPVATPTKNQSITLNVNGRTTTVSVDDPDMPLLYALRNDLHLHGPRFGCGLGQCGACTVLVDGQRINSCLSLAVSRDGAEITTIEGLAEGNELHALQAAFVERDAFQCGYCTPGQICSAVGLMSEGHARDRADIREQMSGNLCRCGAYTNIADAIEDVMQPRAAVQEAAE